MARLATGTLIDRLARGDPQALADLYDRYAGIVNALALQILVDADSADEIVQAVFLQAWREAVSYDGRDGTPLAWLCAMARARALERLDWRRRATSITPPSVTAPRPNGAGGPSPGPESPQRASPSQRR